MMRTLILIFFVPFCYAQNNARLFTSDGQLFRVKMNGNYIHKNPQAEVLIEAITKDTLPLIVEYEQASSGILLYLLDRGKPISGREFDYRLDAAHPSRVVFAGMYDPIPLHDPLVPKKPEVDTSFKWRNNLLGNFCELKEGKIIYFNNLPKDRVCISAMPPAYLLYIEQLMSQAHSGDERYALAENAIRNNCLCVAQLSVIISYSPYELDKLKLARRGYLHLTDRSSRKSLDACFSYKSSVFEFNDYCNTLGDSPAAGIADCKNASDSTAIKGFCAYLDVCKYDSQRLEVFRKKVEDHCYSIQQVQRVLQQFVHDPEKLEAAKLLYFYCTEKESYQTLFPLFSYNETISDLRDFLGGQSGK